MDSLEIDLGKIVLLGNQEDGLSRFIQLCYSHLFAREKLFGRIQKCEENSFDLEEPGLVAGWLQEASLDICTESQHT